MKDVLSNLKLPFALWWSRLALLIERLLVLLFPAILFPVLYLVLALFGVFEQSADPWRLILLAFSIISFGWFFYKNLPNFSWPTSRDAKRRVEADAPLPTGTIAALDDQPVIADSGVGQALWRAQQQKLKSSIAGIKIKRPHSVLARNDILALRIVAVLALFSGFVIAGSLAQQRIETAFYPGYLFADTSGTTIEAWVNSPEYANLPPLFILPENSQNISVLAGSEFVVRVTGTRRQPLLSVNGASNSKQKLTELSKGVFEGRVIINEPVQLSLSRSVSANWSIDQRADLAPVVEFSEQPKTTILDELGFTILASDDFGIEQVYLFISTDEPGSFPKSDKIELVLPKAKQLEQKIELDLTKHLLAGLPVTLHLQAIDGAGQITQSQPMQLVLPNKLLIQPLAKAVAEQRLLIMRSPDAYQPTQPDKQLPVLLGNQVLFTEQPSFRLSQAPAKIQHATALMRSIMRAPEIGIKDPYVWLGLSYVQQRLRTAKTRNQLNDLDLEMWQIILRAEGGELETAAAAMRLAEKALQSSLLLGAAPSELQRLSQKYEMAVKRYLQALAKQALQEQGADGGAGGNSMSSDQLQEMLKALQELAETGAITDARTLLKALAELLQNLKMQMASGGQGDSDGEDMVSEAMRKALEELGEMLGEQREILDQAQQQNNAAENGQAGQQGNQADLAEQQGGLQGSLNKLGSKDALQGSDAKAALKDAETAMGEASSALRQGDSEQALSAGQEALGQLREGAQTLAGEMLERREGDEQRDPFGRQSSSGSASAEGGLVPDLIDPQQARKILQELRKRATEQRRPKQELEYLDRLLERF